MKNTAVFEAAPRPCTCRLVHTVPVSRYMHRDWIFTGPARDHKGMQRKQCIMQLLLPATIICFFGSCVQVKEEGWFIVAGDANTRELLALKRTALGGGPRATTTAVLRLPRYNGAGEELAAVHVYLLSDSYMGECGDAAMSCHMRIQIKRMHQPDQTYYWYCKYWKYCKYQKNGVTKNTLTQLKIHSLL